MASALDRIKLPEGSVWAAGLPVGVIALCLSVIGILWAALFFDLDRMDKSAISQAGHDARNLAMAFRENVQRTVSSIDQLMLAIITENKESGDLYHIPPWVKNSPLLEGTSVQVAMSGPDGIVTASTLPVRGRVDISDRPHFRYHLDPSAPQPYISVPVIGRNSGEWSIQVSRRLTRSDGTFGGIIVVSIDPSYFSRFFDSVDVGQRGSIDLVGRDGIVRVRRAHDREDMGQNVGATPLFKTMINSEAGSEIARSKTDGITRVFGYSAVPNYPLMVVVGLAIDDVLAPFQRQRGLYFAVGSFLTLVIGTLAWFLARENTLRRRREASVIAAEGIREQKGLLDTAVNNMRHGLLMFDKNGVALVVNRSFIEMYRLSPETAKPGCTLRDLLKERTANGTFMGDDNNVDYGLKEKVFDLPDGRSIHVKNRYMADGGWVSTHEDITERRKAEITLEERQQVFDASLDLILVTDRQGNFIGVSPSSLATLGYRPEEMIGHAPSNSFIATILIRAGMKCALRGAVVPSEISRRATFTRMGILFR
jgi:PAS domain-containing protein